MELQGIAAFVRLASSCNETSKIGSVIRNLELDTLDQICLDSRQFLFVSAVILAIIVNGSHTSEFRPFLSQNGLVLDTQVVMRSFRS